MASVKTTRGLGLRCPFCMSDDDKPYLLSDTLGWECANCSEKFTAREAVNQLQTLASRWEAVAGWESRAPVVDTEE